MDKNEICERIFVRCVYSDYLCVTSSWHHSNENTNTCNLVLVCGGQGVFRMGDEMCRVSAGDVVFFPEGVKREMRADGSDFVFRSINFKYRFISEERNKWSMDDGGLPFEFVRHISDKALLARVEQLFVQIQKYYYARQYNREFCMRYYATELIALLLSGGENEATYSERNMIENSIKYMSTHFREKITLDELAELSGKGVSYYGKVFKKITGTTPIKYLLNMRLDYARELLEVGFSVTDACEMSGFENLHYFSRAFKEKEKASPREYVGIYRMQKAEENAEHEE